MKEDMAMNNPQTQHVFMMDRICRKGAYHDGQSFDAWQKEARAKLGELLGMDTFEKCDEQMQIEWIREESEYTEYRVHFNTESYYRALIHIRIPAGIKSSGGRTPNREPARWMSI